MFFLGVPIGTVVGIGEGLVEEIGGGGGGGRTCSAESRRGTKLHQELTRVIQENPQEGQRLKRAMKQEWPSHPCTNAMQATSAASEIALWAAYTGTGWDNRRLQNSHDRRMRQAVNSALRRSGSDPLQRAMRESTGPVGDVVSFLENLAGDVADAAEQVQGGARGAAAGAGLTKQRQGLEDSQLVQLAVPAAIAAAVGFLVTRG
jgi:hypothetical protein